MLLLVHVHGYASAVVLDSDGVILVDCDIDFSGVSCKGLVDGVVNHLIYKMMETFFRNIAYVHCRTFAHCLQALKDLDITGAVFLVLFCHIFKNDFQIVGIRDRVSTAVK